MLVLSNIFKKIIFITSVSLFGFHAFSNNESIQLYTPYTNISVPPGESIDYTIDVLNNSTTIKNIDVYVVGMPKDWIYSLKSGGWNIKQLSVLPGEKKVLNLKVEVPLKVNKGNHAFKVVAKNFAELPLLVNVSEQGTYKTEFTSQQANMVGHTNSTFTFQTNLKNLTGETQLYSLRSNAPVGWNVSFKPNAKQATAVEVEPNQKSNITIEIIPPQNIAAGTYDIPVQALTSKTSANLNLQVVVAGSFSVELTTPMGLLSTSITAGSKKQIELMVKNTGSSALEKIKLSAAKPKNWEVTFNPEEVEHIEAGAYAKVIATLKADEKAIPGDYVTNFSAKTSEANSQASFRISVKTPLLWGWLGIGIILLTIGGIYFLFRKYGRR